MDHGESRRKSKRQAQREVFWVLFISYFLLTVLFCSSTFFFVLFGICYSIIYITKLKCFNRVYLFFKRIPIQFKVFALSTCWIFCEQLSFSIKTFLEMTYHNITKNKLQEYLKNGKLIRGFRA